VTDALPDSAASVGLQDFVLGEKASGSLQTNGPLDENTRFLVATDGFHTSFGEPYEMWQWLIENGQALKEQSLCGHLLSDLHLRLSRKFSDDDVSFVFVTPRNVSNLQPRAH
jgi:hypothetical protein